MPGKRTNSRVRRIKRPWDWPFFDVDEVVVTTDDPISFDLIAGSKEQVRVLIMKERRHRLDIHSLDDVIR